MQTNTQYIAKYVPVEGDLEVGNTVFYRETGEHYKIEILGHRPNLVRLVNEDEVLTVRRILCTPVKLYLCDRNSYNIKDGDEILFPVSWFKMMDSLLHLKGLCNGINEKRTVAHYIADSIYDAKVVSGIFLDENPLKIMGPISENATWVKPDMIFQKSEIKIWKRADEYHSKLLAEMLGQIWEHDADEFTISGKIAKIQIKSPEDGKFY